MQNPSPPTGMVLIRKPAGQTSFRTLAYYKKCFNTTRLGHTGTLDLFATGLMLALVGSATRLARYLVLADKTYVASFQFGSQTDTLDPGGTVIKSAPIPSLAAIEAALPLLRGDIQQIPPDYSAIHVAGKRAYERVLSGEALDLAPRPVRVDRFEIIDWRDGLLSVAVDCSKGTYIRSLARDLGNLCQSAAFVASLDRTRVGPFKVEQAHDPLSVTTPTLIQGRELVAGLGDMAVEVVDPAGEAAIAHGQPYVPQGSVSPIALLNADDHLLAVMELDQGRWRYGLVLAG